MFDKHFVIQNQADALIHDYANTVKHLIIRVNLYSRGCHP